MVLLDSGGQYVDGTTDITRTAHLGDPSGYQKSCFTRVLKVGGGGGLGLEVWGLGFRV